MNSGHSMLLQVDIEYRQLLQNRSIRARSPSPEALSLLFFVRYRETYALIKK